jgi:DNA polymerase-3 subunit chi
MTRIDFYILQDTASDARWHFTCRLVDKALRSGHKVLITVDTPAEAQHLDDLLWSFKPETFIPHEIFDAQASTPSAIDTTGAAVAITTTALADHQLHEHRGLLINLGREIPPWFSRFERLSEIVIQEPDILKNTRDHFSFYRERGYPIEHRHI